MTGSTVDAVSKEERRAFLAAAEEFADRARAQILLSLRSGLDITTKADKSMVSNIDLEIERMLRKEIGERFSQHGVIGEEFPQSNPEAAFQWILDPIDGTEELINGLPIFGTIIGLHYKGKPLVGVIDHPQLDIRLSAAVGLGASCNGKAVRIEASESATRDEGMQIVVTSAKKNFLRSNDADVFEAVLREFPNQRTYACCFAYTSVIAGSLDAMLDYNVKIWDQAACQVLVEEAGGVYKRLPDKPGKDGQAMISACFGVEETVERILRIVA